MDAVITTVSGRQVPVNKSPPLKTISIKDIAHGLSMQCRYNGQVKNFYNVADHSIAVSRAVFVMTDDYKKALEGLLHDAHEAYVGDMATPIKKMFYDTGQYGYDFLEHYMAGSIMMKYGLPDVVSKTSVGLMYLPSPEIKEADRKAYQNEVYWLERPNTDGRSYRDLFAPISGESNISKSVRNFLFEFKSLRSKIT